MTQLLLMVMATTVAAPKPKAICTLDRHDYCIDRVLHYSLSFDNKDPIIKINSAFSIATTIELPPNVKLRRKPKLSNPALFKQGRDNDWEEFDKHRVFDLTPTAPEKAPNDFNLRKLTGKPARLELALDVGITLIVFLRVVSPEPEQSVVRLVLDFPELEKQEDWAQLRVKELIGQWEKDYNRRQEALDKEVAGLVPYERAKAKLAHDECRELVESGETDHAIAITDTICREGDILELHFRVINRARRVFVVERAHVSASSQKGMGYLLRKSSETAQTVSLGRNEQARGIVWWPIESGRDVELQIGEGIPNGRVIRVDKITF